MGISLPASRILSSEPSQSEREILGKAASKIDAVQRTLIGERNPSGRENFRQLHTLIQALARFNEVNKIASLRLVLF